jgi:carbamoyltransferase
MLLVAMLKEELRNPVPDHHDNLPLLDRLYHIRSTIPAVTHVDYSSRIQTVSKDSNPKFRKLITEFKRITGCSMLVNTSFNVRGEPIVCSPEDAYLGFRRTEMDYLVIGNYLFDKRRQNELPPEYAKGVLFHGD